MFFVGIIYVKNKNMILIFNLKLWISILKLIFSLIFNINNVLYILLKEIIGILNMYICLVKNDSLRWGLWF